MPWMTGLTASSRTMSAPSNESNEGSNAGTYAGSAEACFNVGEPMLPVRVDCPLPPSLPLVHANN